MQTSDEEIQKLREHILAEIDLTREMSDTEIRAIVSEKCSIYGKQKFLKLSEQEALEQYLFHSLRKLDVLQELLDDPEITEIMVNGAEHIFYEKRGQLFESDKHFTSKEKLNDVIQQMAGSNNRMVNEASPIVDTRLANGSRVNIVLQPIAIDGSAISIRKFPEQPFVMEDLIRFGAITEEAAEFLKVLVLSGYNIFVSGGTGSGKTTFLNALSQFIPREERIITIEDSAELQLIDKPNLVRLETRNANTEGVLPITIRDLIKTALRMRPNRVIVGECRGAEALDVLQVFALFAVLAGAALIQESMNPVLKQGNVLERQAYGDGNYDAELIWEIPEKELEQELSVHVAEQGLTKEEQQALLAAAEQEIAETFPGENESVDEIRKDVCIQSQYQDGQVTADWSFDSYQYVNLEGHVMNDSLEEEEILVKAVVELGCDSQTLEYQFFFQICPKIFSEKEKINNKLKQELIKKNEKTNDSTLILPESIDDQTIIWKEKSERMPLKLLLLGMIAAGCVPLVEKSRKQEEEKRRKEKLQSEYPELVSKLTILLGAGMTLFSAWNKIATNYSNKRKNNTIPIHPLYEEMLITCHEIESGVGEARAYERFGERCGLHRYRKFCSLLVQNLRKGTRGLVQLLEQEVSDAFEERKNLAKKSGEEAGTKMLFPMMMMFGIIIVIIMVPAFLSLQ